MSRNITYPQSIESDVSRWQVREDGDDYGSNKGNNNVQSVSLSDLHNRVLDRLDRAKAMLHLLKTADTQPDDVLQHTVAILEEHIEQAQTTSRRVWDYMQREKKLGS